MRPGDTTHAAALQWLTPLANHRVPRQSFCDGMAPSSRLVPGQNRLRHDVSFKGGKALTTHRPAPHRNRWQSPVDYDKGPVDPTRRWAEMPLVAGY